MNTITDLPAESNCALILSFNEEISQTFCRILKNDHWQVECCRKSAEFEQQLETHQWLLVLLSTGDDADLAEGILRKLQPYSEAGSMLIVVVTENPSADEAIRYARLGAAEYLAWPLLPSELLPIAHRARRLAQSPVSISSANGFHSLPAKRGKLMIGASRPMLELAQQLVKVAQAPDLSVFINGETGTGKEVVAWQIHQLGNRPGSFRAVNCAAMVESLLESELFGHEKGAFTGAYATKKGLWEEAANGTIFLDEITEASPSIQAKLLRVLQEGTIRRVGSNQEIRVTARVIAASNRELEKAVRKGHFRKDLFYRLGQILRLPPLRERVEDIPLLVNHFCLRTGKEIEIAPEAMELLCAYDWPGNVRELESLINKLATFCGGRVFTEDLQPHLQIATHRVGNPISLPLLSMMNVKLPRQWPTWQQVREQYVMEAYHYFGRESQVARALGMDYRTVSQIIREFEQRQIVQS
nr:sigma-54 dependent transcriptional regulator [Nitrosomonas nitrosa]